MTRNRASPARLFLAPSESRAGPGEQHEHRRTEVRDPARREQPDGDVRIRHRILFGREQEEVPDVVDRHDDDDQPAHHVDGAEAIGALIGGDATARTRSGASTL